VIVPEEEDDGTFLEEETLDEEKTECSMLSS
jgi:hypothetical protein